MLRHLLTIGFIVALAVSSIQPAMAAPRAPTTCYGSSCNGVDPYTVGCVSDAVFVASYAYVARYYSPSCNAYFGWTAAAPYETTAVWMSPNRSATVNFGIGYAYSYMWENGQACTSYASLTVYCA